MAVQSRVRQGKTARRHGKDFEEALEKWFAMQSAQGTWVDIRKQNESLKPIRPYGKGQFMAVYTRPCGCDYFGTMMGGYSLVLEAKHREGDRIAQSDLTDAEKEHLKSTYSLGGYAMLAVEFSDGKTFLFPYALLECSKLIYKFKHIKEADLARDGYGITIGENLYEAVRKNTRKALEVLIAARGGRTGIDRKEAPAYALGVPANLERRR